MSIENWANGVNSNLADHAIHLDLHRDKMEVNRLQVMMTFSESKKAAELAESDLRRVHAEFPVNPLFHSSARVPSTCRRSTFAACSLCGASRPHL